MRKKGRTTFAGLCEDYKAAKYNRREASHGAELVLDIFGDVDRGSPGQCEEVSLESLCERDLESSGKHLGLQSGYQRLDDVRRGGGSGRDRRVIAVEAERRSG